MEGSEISERDLSGWFVCLLLPKSDLGNSPLSPSPPSPSKNSVGEGKKGSGLSPFPGLPYLSDQPLPLSFRLLCPWFGTRPNLPPFGFLEEVSQSCWVWVFVGEGLAHIQISLPKMKHCFKGPGEGLV